MKKIYIFLIIIYFIKFDLFINKVYIILLKKKIFNTIFYMYIF
jgi:hypothetical protein